jgi:Tfp pilus assembly protein PilF
MSKSNSAFISYRRDASEYLARAVFQNLHTYSIDVFYDYESIKAGNFPSIISNQIAARPYFILVLTPKTLNRCVNQDDWVRQEIEQAVTLQRLIIPLFTEKFKKSDIDKFLAPEIAKVIKESNGIKIPSGYFDDAMRKLLGFLIPIPLAVKPTPPEQQNAVAQVIQQAVSEPAITNIQLTAQGYFEQALATDNVDEQIDSYTRAIQIDSNYANAYNNRGFAYLANGEYDKAIEDFAEAIRLKPNYIMPYYNRGFAYIQKGDYVTAIQDCTEAIRLDPNDAPAYYNRGLAYKCQNEYRKAIEDFTVAIHLHPEWIIAYINRGSAYAESFEYRIAIEDYSEAIRLDSTLFPAYWGRANVYAFQKDYKNAIVDAEKILSLLANEDQQSVENVKESLAKWRKMISSN